MNKQAMIAAAMLATAFVASPALADHERGYRNEPNFGGVIRLYFGDIVPHHVAPPRYYSHFPGRGHAFGHQKHHWRAKHRGHHWRGHQGRDWRDDHDRRGRDDDDRRWRDHDRD